MEVVTHVTINALENALFYVLLGMGAIMATLWVFGKINDHFDKKG